MPCRHEHFSQPWYLRWSQRFGSPKVVSPDQPYSYRKAWEWAAILQALEERGVVGPYRRGMGFAVGHEPLVSIFAGLGAHVVASDMPQTESSTGWAQTGQHAASLEALYQPNHIHRPEFDRLVSFVPVDMTAIDGLPDGELDFLWSSCAMEHLGTLERGLDFVAGAMRLLKPGGVAVHTTEFNVVSDEDTVTEGPNCIYSQQDLKRLDYRLRRMRCGLEALDFDSGSHPYDLDYDAYPFFQPGTVHIKLMSDGYVCTSYLLIARKAR